MNKNSRGFFWLSLGICFIILISLVCGAVIYKVDIVIILLILLIFVCAVSLFTDNKIENRGFNQCMGCIRHCAFTDILWIMFYIGEIFPRNGILDLCMCIICYRNIVGNGCHYRCSTHGNR